MTTLAAVAVGAWWALGAAATARYAYRTIDNLTPRPPAWVHHAVAISTAITWPISIPLALTTAPQETRR
jgi:hypothetical protein